MYSVESRKTKKRLLHLLFRALRVRAYTDTESDGFCIIKKALKDTCSTRILV